VPGLVGLAVVFGPPTFHEVKKLLEGTPSPSLPSPKPEAAK
jgi:hypothetical protein